MTRKWFIGVTQVGRTPGHAEDVGLYEAKGETANGNVLDIPPAKGWRSLPGTVSLSLLKLFCVRVCVCFFFPANRVIFLSLWWEPYRTSEDAVDAVDAVDGLIFLFLCTVFCCLKWLFDLPCSISIARM